MLQAEKFALYLVEVARARARSCYRVFFMPYGSGSYLSSVSFEEEVGDEHARLRGGGRAMGKNRYGRRTVGKFRRVYS